MSIKSEFREFQECEAVDDRERRLMRISAKWMAERCAVKCDELAQGMNNDWNKKIGKADDLVETAQDCAESIRQLAKELES